MSSRRNFLKYLGLLPAMAIGIKSASSSGPKFNEHEGMDPTPTREPDYDAYDDDWEDEETSESSSFSSYSGPSSGEPAYRRPITNWGADICPVCGVRDCKEQRAIRGLWSNG